MSPFDDVAQYRLEQVEKRAEVLERVKADKADLDRVLLVLERIESKVDGGAEKLAARVSELEEKERASIIAQRTRAIISHRTLAIAVIIGGFVSGVGDLVFHALGVMG